MAPRQCFEVYKPQVAMVGLQFICAFSALSIKFALAEGVSPMVFIVYRQASATLVLAPVAFIASKRRKCSGMAMGLKGFSLLFAASFVGVPLNQFLYCQGLSLASASLASAIGNMVPAITFLMAASLGLEKVHIRSPRSMAKILGTLICVGGAICMGLFRGTMLMNTNSQTLISMFHTVGENWMMGCLSLLANCCCWSTWLILQVPLCKTYLDPLSLSTWMCFISTLQSAILAFLLEPDISVWRLKSISELLCCLYAGIMGSSVNFYVQSWCISKRGPLFCALFNPLMTVIVTVVAIPLLHEHLYIGSLFGGGAVVVGLYVVLWGKAEDFDFDDSTKMPISVDEASKILKEPLLDRNFNDETITAV